MVHAAAPTERVSEQCVTWLLTHLRLDAGFGFRLIVRFVRETKKNKKKTRLFCVRVVASLLT